MSASENVRAYKSQVWMSRRRAKKYARSVHPSSLGHLQVMTYVRWLREQLPVGSRILDAGAGTGALSRELATEGFRVTAIDISAEMLAKIPRSRRISTAVVDLLEGDVPAGPFDAIVSRWVLPHFPQWPQIVERLRPSLATDGALYVDFPNLAHYSLASDWNGSMPSDVGYAFNDEEGDPSSFYAAPSAERVAEVARAHGLRLDGARSASFLSTNQLIGKEAGERLAKLFSGRLARRALTELDAILATELPNELCPLTIYRLVPESD